MGFSSVFRRDSAGRGGVAVGEPVCARCWGEARGNRHVTLIFWVRIGSLSSSLPSYPHRQASRWSSWLKRAPERGLSLPRLGQRLFVRIKRDFFS